jgi:hypothetical protein
MTARPQQTPQFSESDLDFMIDLAKKRTALLYRIRQLLVEEKQADALALVKQLVGLESSDEQRH